MTRTGGDRSVAIHGENREFQIRALVSERRVHDMYVTRIEEEHRANV